MASCPHWCPISSKYIGLPIWEFSDFKITNEERNNIHFLILDINNIYEATLGQVQVSSKISIKLDWMISIDIKRTYLFIITGSSFHEDAIWIESFNIKYQTVRITLYDRKQSLQSFSRKAALWLCHQYLAERNDPRYSWSGYIL